MESYTIIMNIFGKLCATCAIAAWLKLIGRVMHALVKFTFFVEQSVSTKTSLRNVWPIAALLQSKEILTVQKRHKKFLFKTGHLARRSLLFWYLRCPEP